MIGIGLSLAIGSDAKFAGAGGGDNPPFNVMRDENGNPMRDENGNWLLEE